MEIYFNNLTLFKGQEHTPIDGERLIVLLTEFAKVWKLLSEASGIGQVRCDDESYITIMRVIDKLGRGAIGSYLRKTIRRPFEYEGLEANVHDTFWGYEFYCCINTDDNDEVIQIECPAIGWAFASDSITVGLGSGEQWKKLAIKICIKDVGGGVRNVDVLCVTELKHLSDARVCAWCERIKSPIPVKTDVAISQKNVAIHGDHHGNDDMREFASRLVTSEYVVGVMSAEYQRSNSSPFVNKIYSDGRIRVCMYWEDINYQLIVKTTAINRVQTEYIANLLSAKFDQGHRCR